MRKTIIYSLTFITLGLGLGSLGPTLPALAKQVHVDIGEISSLIVIRSLGTILGSWFLGKLYDRFKGHPILAASITMTTAAMLLIPYAGSLYALMGLFLVLGITYSSINIGGNALIARVHGDSVGPYITTLHLSCGIGGLVAPLIVSLYATGPDSILFSYTTLAVAGAIPIILLFTFASPPSLTHHAHEANNIRFSFSVGLLLFFLFLEVGAEACLMNWLYTFSLGYGMTIETAALINSAFWAAFSIGRLIAIWCFARFNIATIIIINLIVCVLIAPVIPVLPLKQPALWFGAIGLGLAIGPIFPGVLAFTQRMFKLSGKLTGWIVISTASGGMFWPWLIGQFIVKHGVNVMIWVVLTLFITGLAAFMSLSKRNAIRDQKEIYEV